MNAPAVERNLVVCLDGTNNEPEHGATNVTRIYDVAKKSADQLVYYDPGVGTMGARGAVTRLGKALTRTEGLVAGYGIEDNIEEAYNWLSRNYQAGDRIYVFGFSRGAYTARALTGMLHTVGLLRPGTENLTPYAVKLYAQAGPGAESGPDAKNAEKKFWKVRDEFIRVFGNPDFPSTFDTKVPQVHFLGVWDTVKSVGWLNLKGKFETARWPFTRKIDNVGLARHAMALDEKRRPYGIYRFDPDTVANSAGRYEEQWFVGVHSDVGGQFPDDHKLSDVAFSWMVKEAENAGFRVNKQKYHWMLKSRFDDELPADRAEGKIHDPGRAWWLAGGWNRRQVLHDDTLHPSVQYRLEHDKNYRVSRK
ncbi:DUF2235 domain-containing protein [Mycolicibacterium sp. Dal123E01]|uniref:DUF2235 domain-containing protein n=1 Tax=Mycolicibacterium sp. Dal123E01 TaxID=3457578 RepID=UPI00403E70FE